MAIEIILPKIGFSMTEGTLVEWMVEDGAAVTVGSPLYALESEKSTNEVEAPVSGILRILKPADETYEVGTLLGMIE
jgi:pyruvate/2-oxoglutarate dehydrogenase complex dihydrolipoamide acyltransferase (E2) component